MAGTQLGFLHCVGIVAKGFQYILPMIPYNQYDIFFRQEAEVGEQLVQPRLAG